MWTVLQMERWALHGKETLDIELSVFVIHHLIYTENESEGVKSYSAFRRIHPL